MEKASDIIDTFIKQYDEIEKLSTQATKDQSNLELELSSCYHRIEGASITHVSQSHKLIKELQDILNRRRDNKIEAILLRSTCDLMREKITQLKVNKKNKLVKDIEVKQEIKDRAKL